MFLPEFAFTQGFALLGVSIDTLPLHDLAAHFLVSRLWNFAISGTIYTFLAKIQEFLTKNGIVSGESTRALRRCRSCYEPSADAGSIDFIRGS